MSKAFQNCKTIEAT